MSKVLKILGSRGIPARHGGFETFAERLALYLAGRGWDITVYCQEDASGKVHEDRWRGVRLIHIPVGVSGALGTILFDAKSTIHASRGYRGGKVLTLGYNTAVFGLLYRLKKIVNIMNMDGIEWRRGKWSRAAKSWLYCNERIGCWVANHLIADHPEIKIHLSGKTGGDRITVIPYGADLVAGSECSVLDRFGVIPKGYCMIVARPEPENSIREMVAAFSEKKRGVKLLVLGAYDPGGDPYHREVMDAASNEVIFAGSVYDKATVASLRYHCRLYMHGHSVGGTNPSLVEALGAGTPVLAHDNRFNRWVAGEGESYFRDREECARALDRLLGDEDALKKMSAASRHRFREAFTWKRILGAYEEILHRYMRSAACPPSPAAPHAPPPAAPSRPPAPAASRQPSLPDRS